MNCAEKWSFVLTGVLSFKSVSKQTSCEIMVKNSRFIAGVTSVWSQEECNVFLAQKRAAYSDASHNVFAYRLRCGGSLLERQSDDGEPSGTAGKPVLDILTGMQLINVSINITRYFGGTLLGTGGLVRAYQAAAREAIVLAGISNFRRLLPVRLCLPYHAYDKFMHTARASEDCFQVSGSSFGENVTISLVCLEEYSAKLQTIVSNLSQNTQLTFGESYYGVLANCAT